MEKKEISTLFRQYYGRMYGMAVSILYDEQESKDVVSDIFERLLESDTVLLPDTVEHYLLTSVRNSCLKRISQKTNRQRIAMLYASEQQMAASPEEDELRLEQMLHFAKTLHHLRNFFPAPKQQDDQCDNEYFAHTQCSKKQ